MSFQKDPDSFQKLPEQIEIKDEYLTKIKLIVNLETIKVNIFYNFLFIASKDIKSHVNTKHYIFSVKKSLKEKQISLKLTSIDKKNTKP